jgi:hypothetical protein
MRRIALLASAAALFFVGAPPQIGRAQQTGCVPSDLDGAMYCEASAPAVLELSSVTFGSPNAPAAGASQPSARYVPYNRLGTGPDGEPCATTGYVREGVQPPDERLLVDPNPLESNVPIWGNYRSVLETYPPCPATPRVPGQPVPVETRSMTAARYWELVQLPAPSPYIGPGRAITGKTAYLETRGELTRTYTNATDFGPLRIDATGSYTVSWGDGHTSGPYTFEGGPWPDGRITHEYQHVGSYDVVVTEQWTARWSLGGESGVLRTRPTTGTITGFPVQQIQAVIVR